MQLVTVIVKLRISSRLREPCGWVRHRPGGVDLRFEPPWLHGCHGAVNVVGPVTPPGRAIGRGDSQECTQISENGPLEPFWSVCVHFCDASFATRAASGGTSAPTAMACRRRPLGGRLPLGRENRLCVSGATASLVSSPRQQPTQTPGETYLPRIPNKKRLR